MEFFDKLVKYALENKPLPVKGHTKITLTDVNTGKQKIYEDENMVTNAVANIIKNNYSMTMDPSKFMPLRKLFGGIMCFTNALTENADNVSVPCDDDNEMIANAGDEPHATASKTRGNPNGGETVIGPNYVKMVWDWSTNQGNGNDGSGGTIRAVALTSNVGGNAGLKPIDETYYGVNCDVTNKIIRNAGEDLSDTTIVKYPMVWKDSSHAYAYRVSTPTNVTTLEEITVAHDFLTFGIVHDLTDFTRGTSRFATIRSTNPFIFVDDDYYYAVDRVEESSTVKLRIDKIDRSDMSVTTADIVVDSSFAVASPNSDVRRFTTIPFEDGYLYWPKTGLETFYRIDLSNTSDITELTSTVGAPLMLMHDSASTLTDWLYRAEGWVKVGTHVIVGTNYLINGEKIYPCKGIRRQDYTSGSEARMPNIMALSKGDNTLWATMKHFTTSRFSYSGVGLNYYYLATVNNLATSVTKEPNMTMQIEYTITEA